MWGGIRGYVLETTKKPFSRSVNIHHQSFHLLFSSYSTKSLMMQYTPEDRQKIDEYISNSGLLYRQLSEKYHVPVTTIRDGVHGAKQPAICHENQQ